MGQRKFLALANSHKIQCEHHWLLVYLFAGNPFVWVSNLILYFEVAPAKESWGGGGENTDLSRRESRYLDCEAKRSKTNLWLL